MQDVLFLSYCSRKKRSKVTTCQPNTSSPHPHSSPGHRKRAGILSGKFFGLLWRFLRQDMQIRRCFMQTRSSRVQFQEAVQHNSFLSAVLFAELVRFMRYEMEHFPPTSVVTVIIRAYKNTRNLRVKQKTKHQQQQKKTAITQHMTEQ